MESLTNLKFLGLSEDNIKIADNIDNLINLEYLYLNNNKLEKIHGINNLLKLKAIWLYNTNLDTASFRENHPNLKTIDHEIPKSIIEAKRNSTTEYSIEGYL